MAKYIPGFVLIFFFCSLQADMFRIRIEKDDEYLKHLAGMLDVAGAGKTSDGTIELMVNAVESDIELLGEFGVVDEIVENIEITPDYYDLDQIYERVDGLEKSSGGRAQVFVIGRSIEDREIKAVRISKNNSDADLPEILLAGTHHAREWISYEVPLSIAEFIVENMDSNPYVSDILERSVIWLVPVLNPDGYVYSRDQERYWRYNRRINPDMTVGVDLNRNYDSSWMQVEYVHGTGPFSEPETVAIRDLMKNSFEKPFENGIKSLDGLITYHSYGQMILYPPGSTNDPAEKSEYYNELASKMAELTFSECGSVYLVMQTSGLYFTFGE
ncbi:MAG TPA: M14 family zinc carboxypeptidase, partial [bacterium]|nr:M14 family zinc carboxypeptidase [bacterium]